MNHAGHDGVFVASPPIKRARSDPLYAAGLDSLPGAPRMTDYGSFQACLAPEGTFSVAGDALMPCFTSPLRNHEHQWLDDCFAYSQLPALPSGPASGLARAHTTPEGAPGFSAAPAGLPGWPMDSSSPNRSARSAQTWDHPVAHTAGSSPGATGPGAAGLAPAGSLHSTLASRVSVAEDLLDPALVLAEEMMGLPTASHLLARGGAHSGVDVGAGWQDLGGQGDSLMMAEHQQLPQRKKQAVQQQEPATAPASPVPVMGRQQEAGWNLPAINTSRSSGSARASSAAAPAPNTSEGSTNSQQALEGGDGSDHSGGASCGMKEGPSPALRQALEALKERLEAGAANVSGEMLALWRWLLPLTTNTNFFKPCPVCGINASDRSSLASFFDCQDPDQPMCSDCAGKTHRAGHKVLQVRRSTYHEVLKAQDASGLLDVKGIQQYVINGHKVYFLRPRPQPRAPKGAVLPAKCVVDGRQLMEAGHCYCSIRCKYVYEQPEFAALVARVAPTETYSPRPCSKAGSPSSPSSHNGPSAAATHFSSGSAAAAAVQAPAAPSSGVADAAGGEDSWEATLASVVPLLGPGSPTAADAALMVSASPWGGVGGPQQLLDVAPVQHLIQAVQAAAAAVASGGGSAEAAAAAAGALGEQDFNEPPALADLLADKSLGVEGQGPGAASPRVKVSRPRDWMDL